MSAVSSGRGDTISGVDRSGIIDALKPLVARDESDLLKFDGYWLFGATTAVVPIIEYLKKRGKNVIGYIDNRASVLGSFYRDKPLLSPAQWFRIASPCEAIIIASAHQQPIARQLIDEEGVPLSQVFPYINDMFAGHFGRQTIEPYGVDIEALWNGLADTSSRSYLEALLQFRWTMDARYLKPNPHLIGMYHYAAQDTQVRIGDVMVDGGAYNGDTVGVFLDRVGLHGKVYAIEGFAPNYQALIDTVAREKWGERVVPVLAVLAEVADRDVCLAGMADGDARACAVMPDERRADSMLSTTLDALFVDRFTDRIALIKLDIEGAEAAALRGGARLLCRDRPRLVVALYHQPHDLWHIPKLLRAEFDLNGQYYLGHHPTAVYESELFVGQPLNRDTRYDTA